MKNIDIIGGGTVFHVRNHLALCAPAYGTTARRLGELCNRYFIEHGKLGAKYREHLHLTKMAGGKTLETNQDVSNLVDQLVANPDTHIIFFNPALCDFEGAITKPGTMGYEWSNLPTSSGKYEKRLKTSDGSRHMFLEPAAKILGKIRKERKDIFLVAFKTTCGATPDEQFLTGLHLLKTNSCNLVLANDTKTRFNMIITPEQARYYETPDRDFVLRGLVEMAVSRAQGTFTRSTVHPAGAAIPWNHSMVPSSLRKVIDHCIERGAYKPFLGSTVGHFAAKVDNNTFLTSMRRTDFNKLYETGLAYVSAQGDNEVVAYGGKPSVGGQSQRIIFKEHPEMDLIVHFHCPTKPGAAVNTRPQVAHECGSHQCGQNTSDGLKEAAPGIKCVYLDNHGPNIVFNRSIDPQKVIDFIDRNFDLSKSTDRIDRSQNIVSYH